MLLSINLILLAYFYYLFVHSHQISATVLRLRLQEENQMSHFHSIGILEKLDVPRIRKLLTIGLLASLLHLAGDLILG